MPSHYNEGKYEKFFPPLHFKHLKFLLLLPSNQVKLYYLFIYTYIYIYISSFLNNLTLMAICKYRVVGFYSFISSFTFLYFYLYLFSNLESFSLKNITYWKMFLFLFFFPKASGISFPVIFLRLCKDFIDELIFMAFSPSTIFSFLVALQ